MGRHKGRLPCAAGLLPPPLPWLGCPVPFRAWLKQNPPLPSAPFSLALRWLCKLWSLQMSPSEAQLPPKVQQTKTLGVNLKQVPEPARHW